MMFWGVATSGPCCPCTNAPLHATSGFLCIHRAAMHVSLLCHIAGGEGCDWLDVVSLLGHNKWYFDALEEHSHVVGHSTVLQVVMNFCVQIECPSEDAEW